MAKSKFNFAVIGQRLGGIGAGVVAAGVARRYLTNSVGMSKTTVDIGLLGIGAFLPAIIGPSPVVQHAADAMLAKGVDGLLREKMPNVVSGVEDEGVYGAEMPAYPTSDETIVSGIEDSVAGTGVGSII